MRCRAERNVNGESGREMDMLRGCYSGNHDLGVVFVEAGKFALDFLLPRMTKGTF